MPFRIALSGLDAASTDLQVTGHNIANSATNGFKESRAEFADIYANSIQDVSTTSAGRGVRVTRVAQQFSQGNIDFTANNLDLAINGEGFFILEDAAGNLSYTRAGAYSVDRDGTVVDHAGNNLQVFAPIGTSVTSFNTGSTTDLVLPTLSGIPSATTDIDAALNFDSAEAVPTVAYNPNVPDSYNHSTSTTIYDSLGTQYTMTMNFRKAPLPAVGQWDAYVYITDVAGTPTDVTAIGGPRQLNFSPTGILDPALSPDVDASGNITLDTYTPINGATAMAGMTVDMLNTTQYGAEFAVNSLTQDGYTAGRLSGIDIDNSGIVFARFTNGQSTSLDRVALAKFNNAQGLRQLGDTSWAETFTSGDVQMGEPQTSNFGLIQSGGLENSNVDIAEQLVNLITAQRNFQANAQVITTADTITQTIINLR